MAVFSDRQAQHLLIAVDVGGHWSMRAKSRTLGTETSSTE
jgi:hypothetical protein